MKENHLTSKVRGIVGSKHRCLIFEVHARKYGGVAQLGEHLLCKQGVIGSIPFISTTSDKEEGQVKKTSGNHYGLIAQVVRAHA